MTKTITNICESYEKECLLKVDGKYFGYNKELAYPEVLYGEISQAHKFTKQSEAVKMADRLEGEVFVIIPY